MDFEESLPSQSTFLNPGGRSAHQQYQSSSYLDDAEDDVRASSPPPPPPPLHDFQPAETPNSQARAPPAANSTGKFTFLRKNSRKEPSALHRINSPSTSPTGRPTATPSPPTSSAAANSSSTHREIDYLEHGLGGTKKPQVLSSTNSDTRNNVGANTYRSVDGFAETADYSTVSIAGDHWRQQQRSAVDELQEFELIEQQLEYSNGFKPNASTSITHSTATNSHRGPGTKLDDSHVTEESEGWDEAYDVERSTSRGAASRPQPAPISKPQTVAEQYDEDFEVEETYDRTYTNTMQGYEREYAQDDSNEYDVEYNDFGSPDVVAPAPSAVRPRSGSPNSGASARPSANSAQPGARASESPSWGRTTQPVENSYNSGDDHSDGPLSAVSHGSSSALGRTARMSESTLRKISTRTAALHQSTRPTLERPVLADDTSGATEDADSQDAPARGVVYTRPLSTQRRLANTLAAPSSANQAKARSGSAGRSTQAPRGAAGASTSASDYMLSDKARELEAELQTYRSENATLKKLRRQQEQALAEVVSQKEEVLKWAAEEKMRTAKWCDEQQQLAVRERNAAAKMARDTRQKALGGTVPIRKEKAEIEALQATVEKMKVDHEQAAKKWKLTENRLYGLIKDHTSHIEEAEKQLLALEHEKIQLLEFISGQGLLLPKNLRSALQRTPLYRANSNSDVTASAAGGSSKASIRGSPAAQDALRGKTAGASARDRKPYGDDGYVEEVDVDVVDASTSRHTADAQVFASTSGTLGPPKKSAVKPTPSPKSGVRGAPTNQSGDLSSRPTSSTQRASSAPRGGSRPASSLARTDVLPSASNSNRESWARSSRSSGGRYDDCEASDRDDPLHEPDSFRAYEATAQRASGTATKASGDSASSRASASTFAHTHSAHDSTSAADSHTHPSNAGRMEEDLPTGGKVIRYKNGTVKEVDKEGNSTVRFLNGDTKTVSTLNGTIVYFYAEAATTHTTFKDGLEVYEFPNKQVEMHFPDGVKEIIFPDGTRKVINPDGMQESHFPDGVILREHPDGRKEVLSTDSV